MTVADDPQWDDLFASPPQSDPPRGADGSRASAGARRAGVATAEPAEEVPAASRREQRDRERSPRGREKRPRGSRKGGIVLLVVLLVVVGGGAAGVAAAWGAVSPLIEKLQGEPAPEDFSGTGNGTEVQFAVTSGENGSDIATNLNDAGVTKSYQAAYSLMLADPTITFQPGSYTLQQEMSAASALAALQDSSNRVTDRVVIPEGTAAVDVYTLLADATGIPLDQVQAAAADPASFGLPAEATSLEGWLFPATYELDPGLDARGYLQQMVDTMKERLAAAGVQPADQQRIVVFASLIQREAGLAADYPKVARVFQNRLDQGMLLQSDATVAYGTGNTHRVTTTDAERGDADNPYNTYQHEGLPVGPISNPGDLAIDAAVAPADGSWLYFVTTNLDTGETAFSTTFAEHEEAVAVWQAWMREHPEYQ
ncbi:endolytic transglycosylase MltG [Frigoribacterium sp. CFBP 13707]|nr:endolytic transglycosylase MltG [Frigoribacterium sp. CFBP 13707]MBD8728003.1 endolytic transglycosylase MltG [Frigoribacterium sp. CFBP 13707]